MKQHHYFRLFAAWDFDREERWINRMSQKKGFQLKRVGLCHYVFEEGQRGQYIYRLELLHRTQRDEAEKQYLRSIAAEEVCSNGQWGYYRIDRKDGPFAQYTCADSKLTYLKPIYRRYLAVGAAIYLALAMDMSAFLAVDLTAMRLTALVLLTILAFGYTVGLTSFFCVQRRLQKQLNEETGGQPL